MEKLFNLKGKIAVVTGGLGLLGAQYVKALVKAGVKVAVFDIKEVYRGHGLLPLENENDIYFLKINISDKNEVIKGLDSVINKWGIPNILINNAAIDFPPKYGRNTGFEDYPIEEWDAVVKVNLTGMLICCQVIGGAMAKSNGGSVINISSTYGLVSPDQRIYKNFTKPVSYGVTKSGVLNLTKYLATYWGDKNVRVNTLTPGGVFNDQDKDFVKQYCDKVPFGRMAHKHEYNGAILFLASDASSYMTGSNLVVDGGWTAW